ncbi:MAG: histidinol-phosphate transaminase [Coriobacteriales bacterium]|nr:histidinol-phosphate transaminase [Coriobacteriales bacterium]
MALSITPEVRALMRPSAATLEPYDPGFSPVDVNLSANENGFGMPASVREAVQEALAQVDLSRYPVPLADELRAELADWHGVTPDQVHVSNGGDEALFNLFLAFGGEGHTLVSCPPTFSVYRLYAELAEMNVVEVPRNPVDFSIDLDALMEAARTAHLVVITSPNNHTGDLFPHDQVARLCEACPGIVLMDEAYIEFAPASAQSTALIDTYPNLVVLRTLSKAFAFAGGRLGYVMGNPGVLAALAAVRQPYSVNVLTQAAALAIVRHRTEFAPTIREIVSERERVRLRLGAMPCAGVTVWPSESNFLCVRVPNAGEVRTRLRDEHSVLVRDFSKTPGSEDCLRVTIGTPEENDRFLAALVAVLEGSGCCTCRA